MVGGEIDVGRGNEINELRDNAVCIADAPIVVVETSGAIALSGAKRGRYAIAGEEVAAHHVNIDYPGRGTFNRFLDCRNEFFIVDWLPFAANVDFLVTGLEKQLQATAVALPAVLRRDKHCAVAVRAVAPHLGMFGIKHRVHQCTGGVRACGTSFRTDLQAPFRDKAGELGRANNRVRLDCHSKLPQ